MTGAGSRRERNIIETLNPQHVKVRIERTEKFVATLIMDEHTTLGGDPPETYGLDPDLDLRIKAKAVPAAWAQSRDGIMGYLAQWGFLEQELKVIHHVKVFVNGELAWEGDVP